MSKKIEWIAPLKGIGILAVVAGHVYSGDLQALIFVFHMPLFFFVGGFLLKPKTHYLDNLKHKAVVLLVPYASFLSLLYGAQVLKRLVANPDFSIANLVQLALQPLFAGHLFLGITSVFWFTGCFFLTQQLANYLVSKLPMKTLWLIITVFLGASYGNYLWFPTLRLPWSLNVLLGATPIYLLGFLFAQVSSRRRYYLAALPICIVTAFYIFGDRVLSGSYGSLPYDMKFGIYGIPGLSLIAALGIVVALIGLCEQAVVWTPRLAGGFAYIGNASMVIMYVHVPFLFVLMGWVASHELLTLLSLVGSLVTQALLQRSQWGRAFFLGSSADLASVTQNWPSPRKLLKLT